VSLTEAYELGLSRQRVKNLTQLVRLLQEKYPEHNWDKMFIMKGRFGQQRRLEHAVSSLFPVRYTLLNYEIKHLTILSKKGVELIVNAREEAGIINPASGFPLELDIFLPSLNLAFEYQVYLQLPPSRLNSYHFQGTPSLSPIHVL